MSRGPPRHLRQIHQQQQNATQKQQQQQGWAQQHKWHAWGQQGELEMRTSRREVLKKFSPHELDIILGGVRESRARQKVCSAVWPGAQRLLLWGEISPELAPPWPKPAWFHPNQGLAAHAAGSHPWATSSPSVETHVLSTSATALSRRARDLTMAVNSHCLYFKLQVLTSSAPRRNLPTFLTRRSESTHVWWCMMHTHITSKWLPINMHITRLFLLFLPTSAYLHCDRRKRCVLNFDPHTFS